jgi:hypothetical protein
MKQETLEDTAKKFTENLYYKVGDADEFNGEPLAVYDAFIAGAKWQQERMYSEEDMRNAFDSAREFNSLDGVVDVHIVLPMGGDMSDLQPLHFTFDDWFEQFSKLKNG